jgi:hypothetical protein
MNGEWYCSEACAGAQVRDGVEASARPQPTRPQALPRVKIGLLLVHQGAITPVQLREALAVQPQTRQKLGRLVIEMGFTDAASVVRALATQAGVPCLTAVDAGAVRAYPDVLGSNAVRALGLVPIGADRVTRRVKVACAAPVPRLALGALKELTGWTGEPFLVPDHVMPELTDAYARLVDDDSAEPTVLPLERAATLIARAAASTADATVTQASCDPYLWIRVDGGVHPRDLFVTAPREAIWQAAPTSH